MKSNDNKETKITKNCYMCVNYVHSYLQNEQNPLLIQPADYCHYKGIQTELPEDYFYKPHDCCVLYPMSVAEIDPDLKDEVSPLKIKQVVADKYPN